PGTGAARIAQRLAASTALRAGDVSTDGLPDISHAFEYGEARVWAMNLARDVADLRAGKLDWESFPKGIVLHSEPGLGKSLFSRAVGHYCKVPVVATSVADWFATDRSYLDEVVRNMRAAFTSAQSLAQGNGVAILFIDEIDAIPNRATLDGRNAEYFRVFCNDILLRLDARRNVVVIGATNHISAIDPALLRPGRLEKTVRIERPDYAGTLNILKFHVRSELPDEDLAEIAGIAERSTGAEIMHFVREGRRIARQAGRALTAADLRAALMPTGDMPPDMLRRVCLHEAGHAVGVMANGCGHVRRITVRTDGDMLAHALIEHNDDDLLTRRRIEDRVIVLLAGRAAEHVLLKGVSDGAGGDSDGSGDLSRATSLVAMMNASFGMGSTIAYLGDRRDAMVAVRTDPAFRTRVESELKSLQKRADNAIRKHRLAVVAIAEALQDRRHLSGETVRTIFDEYAILPKTTSLN
ncbi:MAG: ATPase, central region, partial [Rhizobium sp.]|nr:ATPase, central region [Rhizobium sp.]